MASVNKVILVGNLGADPELRALPNGGKVVNLRVATSETWKDKNTGEKRERTEWHRVVIFNENLADIADKYLQKGSKLYIEGQLQTRKWDKDGVDMYSTEIVLQAFNSTLVLLGDPDGGRQDNGRDDRAQDNRSRDDRGSSRPAPRNDPRDHRQDTGARPGANRSGQQAPRQPAFQSGGFDDDIPF